MFAKRDFDLFRVSDAANGPLVISEDLMRCMVLYNYKDHPSVLAEVRFLQEHYGKNLADLLKRKQFVVCEYMDIVWSYFEVEGEWAKQQYFAEKASYLKSLRDNLEMTRVYHFYEDLEPFELLDNAFDVAATLKDLSDSSPIAWIQEIPITSLQKRLKEDATDILVKLPEQFGCLGYNFTKRVGRTCIQDGCGLSLYRNAEFDFSQEGIMLNVNNIALFNYKKLQDHFIIPNLSKQGDKEALTEKVKQAVDTTPPAKKIELDPVEAIYDLFLKTQKEVLNPLSGDKKALKQVLNLFST